MTLRDLAMRLSHFKFIYFCLLQSTFFHPGDCVNGTLLSRRLRTAALQLIYVYLHCWQALSLYFVLIKGWNMTALANDFHLINFSEALLGGSQVSGSEWRRRCRCLMMNKWSYFSHRTLITSQQSLVASYLPKLSTHNLEINGNYWRQKDNIRVHLQPSLHLL